MVGRLGWTSGVLMMLAVGLAGAADRGHDAAPLARVTTVARQRPPDWTRSLGSVVRVVGVRTVSWSLAPDGLVPTVQQFAHWDHLPLLTPDGFSIGAGFSFARRGLYVTNRHVVAGSTDVFVILRNGRRCAALPIASDAAVDLGILAAPGCGTPPLLPSLTPPYPGEPAIAIGTPYGFGQSISTGVVSGPVDGLFSVHNPEQTLLQSDVTMNPGNSGGPLLDQRGRVIGINTAIWSPTGSSIGLSFSIPQSLVWPAATELLHYGRIWRGHLGLTVAADRLHGAPIGVRVVHVTDGGAGAAAGIRSGDILTGLGRTSVITLAGFTWRLGLIPPGRHFCLSGLHHTARRHWCGRMGWPKAAWPGAVPDGR